MTDRAGQTEQASKPKMDEQIIEFVKQAGRQDQARQGKTRTGRTDRPGQVGSDRARRDETAGRGAGNLYSMAILKRKVEKRERKIEFQKRSSSRRGPVKS